MVVTRNELEEWKALQYYLSNKFQMKDFDMLKYFLGIEVSRSKHEFFYISTKIYHGLVTRDWHVSM